MLIEFQVHYECNAALFSLTLRVITPVWRDKTDATHSVSIILVAFVIGNLHFNLKDRFLFVRHGKIS